LKKGRTRQGAALFSCCENDRETVITPENSTILFLSYGFSLGIMVLRGEKLKEYAADLTRSLSTINIFSCSRHVQSAKQAKVPLMFNTIKSKLVLFSFLGFLAVGISVSISYFIAVHEVKTIMQADVGAVADALEKSITYIAAVKPSAYEDPEFKKLIYAVKIGKSGYPFMLNDQGTLVVHHKDEGKNLAGQPHIDHIRSHRESGYYEYTATTTGQDKIVAYRYIKPWGLWIVPGVNKADYFDQLKITFLKWNTLCGVVIIMLLSAASFWIVRSISRPIRDAAAVADRLATGDLTADFAENRRIALKGEIGALANAQRSMVAGLNTMVARINSSAQELSGISGAISDTAGEVTSAAGQQAASIDETSRAVDAINASVREVAQGVDSLSMSAAETSSTTLEMASSVEEVAMNVETLAKAVEEVSSSLTEMSAAAKQIGGSVQGLLEISSTTASSIVEMDSSIRQVGDNAGTTAEIAREVMEEAEAGRASVQATITGIAEIGQAFNTTAEVIKALSVSAADIGTILRVIDEVTAQTNLLALNAAIIAAQAGDHGKGFAVVADEIKELANRTRNSTSEIGTVVAGVLEKTDLAVKTIATGELSIESGAALSRQSGKALEKIVARVKNSADQIGEIAAATVEQAKGSRMISQSMENMARVVAQIGTATREQERGNELIMAAVERMKEMNSQVRNSTREQTTAGKEIARSTEQITTMIWQIKEACADQSGCSDRIVGAMDDIARSAGVNLQATTRLNEAVAGLAGQVNVLQQEMAGFRTR
jgi:methyl-accepting chemotaxis protein